MKKSTAVFILSGMIGWSIVAAQCTSKPKQEQNQDDYNATKNDSTQLLGYACPMHAEVRGKEGDKCSKCGMKLVAVKTSDSTATHH